MTIDQLLKFAVDQGASDLHLQTGAAPMLRVRRVLTLHRMRYLDHAS